MEISKAMNVKHSENLVMAVKMMASNPPDLYLISKEGFQISTNRSILSLLSPYLSQIFSGIPGWINPSIHIPDVSANTINKFLKVVYTCFSTVNDVDGILTKEADSVHDVAKLLGIDIQLQAKIKSTEIELVEIGSNTHNEETDCSKDVNGKENNEFNQNDEVMESKDIDKSEIDANVDMEISEDSEKDKKEVADEIDDLSNSVDRSENEDVKDYDTTFYSIEENDCSSFDSTFADSDIEDMSDTTVTYYEMSDKEVDDNSDIEEAAANIITADNRDTKAVSMEEAGCSSLDRNMADSEEAAANAIRADNRDTKAASMEDADNLDSKAVSMEEAECSSLDRNMADSDLENSNNTMTCHEIPDSDLDENFDNEKPSSNINGDDIGEPSGKVNINGDYIGEPSGKVSSDDNHDTKAENASECCQLCSATFLNKDIDEVMEHYFVHLEASLEESCGYLISQDGKCKVCLKYVTGENCDRTVGLRHLGVDHDKLFFIFDKNGIILPDDMFSSAEEQDEYDSSETLETVNLRNDDPSPDQGENVNIKDDCVPVEQLEAGMTDNVHATGREDNTSPLEQMDINIEYDIASVEQVRDIPYEENMVEDICQSSDNFSNEDKSIVESEIPSPKPLENTIETNVEDRTSENVSIAVNMENNYSDKSLDAINMESSNPGQESVNMEDDKKSDLKRKRVESDVDNYDDNVEDLLNKKQRVEDIGGTTTFLEDMFTQSAEQQPVINSLPPRDLIGTILEDLIGSVIGNYGSVERVEMDVKTTHYEAEQQSQQIGSNFVEANTENLPNESILEATKLNNEMLIQCEDNAFNETILETENKEQQNEEVDYIKESEVFNDEIQSQEIELKEQMPEAKITVQLNEDISNADFDEQEESDMNEIENEEIEPQEQKQEEEIWERQNEDNINVDFSEQEESEQQNEDNNINVDFNEQEESDVNYVQQNENDRESEDFDVENDQQKESIINYFKENEINGDSEFDSDSDNEIEEIDERFNPTELTTYTKSKMKGFPQPVAVLMLENEYNLIYIIGDGHCLFRSLAHGMGYTPEMNMHLQIRQQIALEGLRRIRFYYKLSNYYLSTPNSLPAFEAYLKKILYGGATWGCNIDLAIASKLYQMDIYKLCYNSTSNRAYYSVFSAFDGALEAERFVIIHFDDSHKGGEHYSALEKIGGNVRPQLQVTDSVQSWVEMPDGTGKWSRFGAEQKVVKAAAVEVSVDISDDSDSETEEVENEPEEKYEVEIEEDEILVEEEVNLVEDDDNEVEEGFNDMGEDFSIEYQESDEQLLIEPDDDAIDEFDVVETEGNIEDVETEGNVEDVETEGIMEEDLVGPSDEYNEDSSTTDMIFEKVQGSEIEVDNDDEILDNNFISELDKDNDDLTSQMQASDFNSDQFVIDNDIDEEMDDADDDMNGIQDESVQDKNLTDDTNRDFITMENENDDDSAEADAEDNQTVEMDIEDNEKNEDDWNAEVDINDLRGDETSKDIGENIDGVITRDENSDLVTEISIDNIQVTDNNILEDANTENGKKRGCLDDSFIGPKIKLSVDKFEKLVEVFVSAPNMSSLEIENVSRSLDLSVKDGRWAFLKLKHKMKTNTETEDCSAVLDLLQRVKDSNIQDNIFTF